MTTENQVPEVPAEDNGIDQLALLKQRATMLGIPFSNNIGVEALRAKIAEKQKEHEALEAKQEPVVTTAPAPTQVNALTGEKEESNEGKSPAQLRAEARQQAYARELRLMRVNITMLNPDKQDLKGEIFTVANDLLGTIRKYVPYNQESGEAWHIPYWIYTQLKAREFQQIKVNRDKQTGREIITSKLVKEFAIELLDPLTKDEIAKLAAAQKAAGSVE